MFKHNGTTIRIDRDLVIGDGADAITIPALSLQDAATREQYGITCEDDPVPADERYYWNGDVNSPKDIDVVKQMQLARIAESRYALEVGGIELPDGTKIKTDRESQAQLSSAFTSLSGALIPDTPWKAVTGWVNVTLAQIQPIAAAVATHVRACFAAERAKADALAAQDDFGAVVAFDTKVTLP